ncbi:hypothetical protein [Ancylobacter oerskovii]|uniref:Uncharacterized protein n=1 Tax=Ancylobacter oerskovii TaxID=459519 RepID=A0ABW4Z2U7_9HYPH|nr:hypothetical protein [Ancylobacter oerskovii]MBS7546275.1 hypothetical protein [Ancylobacter oerskovii]
MQSLIDQPLTRPIVLNTSPPRTIGTVLAAIACLNDRGFSDDEIDRTIEQLMRAAGSGDAAAIAMATDELEAMLRRHGLV